MEKQQASIKLMQSFLRPRNSGHFPFKKHFTEDMGISQSKEASTFWKTDQIVKLPKKKISRTATTSLSRSESPKQNDIEHVAF